MIVNSIYTGIVSEIMSSNDDYLGQEMPLDSLESSEGESYDDILYGSDVQPPEFDTGFVMVHENCQ